MYEDWNALHDKLSQKYSENPSGHNINELMLAAYDQLPSQQKGTANNIIGQWLKGGYSGQFCVACYIANHRDIYDVIGDIKYAIDCSYKNDVSSEYYRRKLLSLLSVLERKKKGYYEKLEGIQQQWMVYWRKVSQWDSRGSMDVPVAMLEAYDKLVPEQQKEINSILGKWIIDGFDNESYVACFIIRERHLVAMMSDLQKAIDAAKAKRGIGAEDNVQSLKSLLDFLRGHCD